MQDWTLPFSLSFFTSYAVETHSSLGPVLGVGLGIMASLVGPVLGDSVPGLWDNDIHSVTTVEHQSSFFNILSYDLSIPCLTRDQQRARDIERRNILLT